MSNPTLPPAPWTAKGNRVYAADGEEVAVATNASPRWRECSDATARLIAASAKMYLALQVIGERNCMCATEAKLDPAMICRTCVARGVLDHMEVYHEE